jgi:predicted TIM-barrel fold metal-dependent hydrolase
MLTRRKLLLAAAQAARPYVVETHIHLFASDRKRFPLHPNAAYRDVRTLDVWQYCKFAQEAGIAHCVIVHPEPYQDDHSLLEYAFQQEHVKGFFRSTCLLDPILPETPARMEEMARRNQGRMVAIRIHSTRPRSAPATTTGPIRDRDLKHPGFRAVWKKAEQLNMAVQCHIAATWAPEIAAIARDFPKCRIIIDHLGHGGTDQKRWGYQPGEFEGVLALAKLPQANLKVSALRYSSREEAPHKDIKPLLRAAYDAFGPGRLIWGGLGSTVADFAKARDLFHFQFDFAPAAAKAKIMGGNAKALFGL